MEQLVDFYRETPEYKASSAEGGRSSILQGDSHIRVGLSLNKENLLKYLRYMEEQNAAIQ